MQLPVDLLHWSLAFLPILTLAFLLVQLRWTAQQAFGTLGSGWIIDRANGIFEGGADPRGDGAALGC